MANHYHLLSENTEGQPLTRHAPANGIYTQSFNRRHKRVGHLFQGRFKAILVERESHLLELCRYIVLNPLRVKGTASAQSWRWSSYRATAGLAAVPEFLSTDWILAQFGNRRAQAQKQYREFVRDGVESRPWEELKGQIYLGSEEFIEKHPAPNTDLKEIPRVQLRAAKPSLNRIFAKRGDRAIAEAYDHGYRLHEIAAHLGVHYATVRRRLKQLEQAT